MQLDTCGAVIQHHLPCIYFLCHHSQISFQFYTAANPVNLLLINPGGCFQMPFIMQMTKGRAGNMKLCCAIPLTEQQEHFPKKELWVYVLIKARQLHNRNQAAITILSEVIVWCLFCNPDLARGPGIDNHGSDIWSLTLTSCPATIVTHAGNNSTGQLFKNTSFILVIP